MSYDSNSQGDRTRWQSPSDATGRIGKRISAPPGRSGAGSSNGCMGHRSRSRSTTGKRPRPSGWVPSPRSEVAGLQVRDCLLGYGQSALVVREGKGRKQRGLLFIPQELKTRLKAFLAWKKGQREDVSNNAPVFTGQRVLRRGRWSGGCRSR